MKHPTMQVSAVVAALMLAGVACVQASTTTEGTTPPVSVTTPALAPGQIRVATRVAAPFGTLAGSQENAVALATALRSGTPVTLTYVSSDNVKTTTTITPTTKPMGWGNVSHALALAKFSLVQAGITNPTGSELTAALVGGSITASDGSNIPLSGVLQQRAGGMGWGAIAHTYGTTMGAVNRSIKAPSSIASTPTPTSSPVRATGGLEPQPTASVDRMTTARSVVSASAGSAKGFSNAGGTSTPSTSKGLTTAGGTPASTGPGSKGLTTASGARAHGSNAGIVSAEGGGSGQAHGHGRGIVSAAGGNTGATSASTARAGASAGTVTASGATASGIVTALPGHGNGNSNGKGKGGG